MNSCLQQLRVGYLLVFLVLGLCGCQLSESPKLQCPKVPSSTLKNAEKIDIAREKFQKQGTMKPDESIGFVFAGRQGQIIDFHYENICVWFYAPDNSFLTKNELPLDGNYVIQIESPERTTEYEIELSDVETEVLKTMDGYLQAKPQILGPPFDGNLLNKFGTGKFYKDHLGAIKWLRENNAYYTYELARIDDSRNLSVSGDTATIDLSITQDLTLYIDGERDETNSTDEPIVREYRFTLQKVGVSWKISD